MQTCVAAVCSNRSERVLSFLAVHLEVVVDRVHVVSLPVDKVDAQLLSSARRQPIEILITYINNKLVI